MKESKTGKVSFRLPGETMDKLDDYAEKNCNGNRTAAVEDIFETFFKSTISKKSPDIISSIDAMLQEEIKFAADIEPDKVDQYLEDRKFVYATQMKILEAIASRNKRNSSKKPDTFGE